MAGRSRSATVNLSPVFIFSCLFELSIPGSTLYAVLLQSISISLSRSLARSRARTIGILNAAFLQDKRIYKETSPNCLHSFPSIICNFSVLLSLFSHQLAFPLS
ncbi:hypothetical protein NE237_015926 [Protea cynaroides]|uniref:Uncharacterized protein n=1 Tax=Protea cynaroides TaxID=273540 RepID=A0A9Q0QRI8_9MAGN|nr:hypothetical protein NE237_015926 [Protea cynaroides]